MWWDQKWVLCRVPSQVVSRGGWLLPVQLRLETLGWQKKKIFPKLDSLAACQLYQADSPRRRFPEWLMTEQTLIFACLMGHILQSLQFPDWVVCLLFENQIHVLCIKLTVPKKKPQPWDWVSVSMAGSRLPTARCWGSYWSCPHVLPCFIAGMSRASVTD